MNKSSNNKPTQDAKARSGRADDPKSAGRANTAAKGTDRPTDAGFPAANAANAGNKSNSGKKGH